MLNIVDTQEEKIIFQEIFDMYSAFMFYIAKGIIKDEQIAEDAVQESFIRIAKNISKIKEVDKVETKNYIAVIVKNVSYNMIRGETAEIIDLEQLKELKSEKSLEDKYLEKVDEDLIVKQILKLPDKYKEILYLKYLNDLDNEQISKALKLSKETVRKRLERAKNKLLYELETII